MSHSKERKEKNCLNCNAQVMGRYCHICGQENIEPKESAFHLVNHFFQDITHFDGKFFSTLWLLISRPGFLSAEYARGRRASYLNPVRMYVFTSAFFFLVFFTIFKIDKSEEEEKPVTAEAGIKKMEAADSLVIFNIGTPINGETGLPADKKGFKKIYDSSVTDDGNIKIITEQYRSREEYDSLLKAGVVDDNWLERKIKYKEIEIREKYKNNPRKIFSIMGEILLHKLPQMLFISLPILALLLKLFYIRRKEFYYVSHGIFSLHLYIFIFIALLFSFALDKLYSYWHIGLISVLKSAVILLIFFYIYKAMRNFYRQGRIKTLLKYFLLFSSFSIVVAILFTFFLVFSMFTI
ncbi:MAG: DUF3667 domain-containing protein [Ferruginibacter sp.]